MNNRRNKRALHKCVECGAAYVVKGNRRPICPECYPPHQSIKPAQLAALNELMTKLNRERRAKVGILSDLI